MSASLKVGHLPSSDCRSNTCPKLWGASYRGLLGAGLEWQIPKCLQDIALLRDSKVGLGPHHVSPESHVFLCGTDKLIETLPRLELTPPVPGLQGS